VGTRKRKAPLSWFKQRLLNAVKAALHDSTITGKPLSCPVNAALNYSARNIHQRLTLREVAKATGFQAECLGRRFREDLGISFSEFQLCARALLAMVQLYWVGEPPQAAVADEGFRELAYLCRVLKELSGMTPREIHEKGEKDLTPEGRTLFRSLYFKLWQNIKEDLETEDSDLKPAQKVRRKAKLDREFEAIIEEIQQFIQTLKDHPEVIFTPKAQVNKSWLSKSTNEFAKSASEFSCKKEPHDVQ